MPLYPNDMYNPNSNAHKPRPVDATASFGRNSYANQQHIPHRPRPQPRPHEEATYLQPPALSAAHGWQEAGQSVQQQNVAQDSSASFGRRPYPPVNPAHSREDLSMNRPPSREHTRTSSGPQIPSKRQSEHPFSPHASTMPELQTADVGSGKKAQNIVDSTSSDIPDDDAMQVSANCDGCSNAIRCSQPRVMCTECYDYDLCISCFQLGRVSKQHKNNHRVSHILSSQRLCQEDLIPPLDIVNPEHNPEKTKVNWSIHEVTTDSTTNGGERGAQCWRMIHLHGKDSHARFLTSAKPGHFAITLYLELSLSSLLGQEDRKMLQKEGIGWLRVSLGTLRNKKDFFTGRYRENTFDYRVCTEVSLPHKVLKEYWWDIVRIPIGPQLVQINSDVVLSVEGRQGVNTDLGLILQWSGVRSFESNNESLTKIAVNNIRIDNLLDYNEPLIRVPAPDAPKRAPEFPPAPAPAASVANTDTTGDDNEELSVEDWIAALVQIRQEVQDAQQRAILEEALRLRAEQEEQEKRKAIFEALYFRGLLEGYARIFGGEGSGFY